jgi:hypothetical protein
LALKIINWEQIGKKHDLQGFIAETLQMRSSMFIKRTVLSIFIAVVAYAACSGLSSASAEGASAAVTAPTPTANAHTIAVVDAANAFLSTLSEAQKKAVLFAFTDAAQRVRWSNFPDGAVSRSGVRWGELNAAQRIALMGLLAAVLSPEGVLMVREQMDADDMVKKTSTGGPSNGRPPRNSGGPPNRPAPGGLGGPPPGGRPPVNFGSDYYFVSFVGAPSPTSPWMLQFGGHHLAINATVVGPNVTLSPSVTGGEPLKYTKDGKAIYIVENEVKQATAMLNSLTAEQRRKAIISDRRIDLVLGPGHDSQILQPEGLPGSEMTDAQKARLLAVIEARLGILNADNLAVAMADARKNLNLTYFAWYGSTTEIGGAYFRVTGPTVLMEYAPQDMDGDATDHAHNMYRDPTNEYGAAWTSLK